MATSFAGVQDELATSRVKVRALRRASTDEGDFGLKIITLGGSPGVSEGGFCAVIVDVTQCVGVGEALVISILACKKSESKLG